MAPRKTQPPQRQPAILGPQAMSVAIERLKQRVAELEAFDPNSINKGDDPPIQTPEAAIESSIARIFGPESHEYSKLRLAWSHTLQLQSLGQ
jgi:hypothetical protein